MTNASRGRLAWYSAGLESPWEQSLASSNLALGAILLPDDVLTLYHVDLRTYDPILEGVQKGVGKTDPSVYKAFFFQEFKLIIEYEFYNF